MMNKDASIALLLEQLKEACPAGYAAAMHIKFTSPKHLFQGYRADWIDYYSKHALVLHDPTVHWGFENTGSVRWSDLAALDGHGVMARAAEYGLVYGFTAALDRHGSRSVASFARADREYTDAEMQEISAILGLLHEATFTGEPLPRKS